MFCSYVNKLSLSPLGLIFHYRADDLGSFPIKLSVSFFFVNSEIKASFTVNLLKLFQSFAKEVVVWKINFVFLKGFHS